MIVRKKTKKIFVGGVAIGGDSPITIQSMTNTDTKDIEATVKQVIDMENHGLDIIRMAVNDEEDAKAINEIKKKIHVPVIADIQFDYKLALMAAREGYDCIRINPGNLNSEAELREIVEICKDKNLPIRVGANSGSISKKILDKYKGLNENSLVYGALEQVEMINKLDFYNIKVSIKSSDVNTCIDANRLFSSLCDYPLHLGLTEAGSPSVGIVKSSIAIGTLLKDGIGDTIRVSLTSDPLEEVIAAKKILSALGIRRDSVNLVSCPTCARTKINIIPIVEELEPLLNNIKKDITVAVMGCPVNGPGEAKNADIGISMSKEFAYLFKKGKVIKKLDRSEVVEELLKEIERMWSNDEII